MFDLKTRIAKARYQILISRMMNSLERTYGRKINIILDRQYKAASNLVLQGKGKNIDSAVNAQKPALKTILDIHYKRTGAIFNKFAVDSLDKKKGYYPPFTKGMADDFWKAYWLWSRKVMAMNVVATTKTTKLLLKRIIGKGFADGLSNVEIVKNMGQARKLFNPIRALRIARTETHAASVASMNTSVEITDIDFEREWIWAMDDRVRGLKPKDEFSHNVDETVGMKEQFVATGEALDYPGDMINGSAGNVINCRCVIGYVS